MVDITLLYIVLVFCALALATAGFFAWRWMRLRRQLAASRSSLLNLSSDSLRFVQDYQQAILALSSISNAVLSTDGQGRIRYINPAAESLLDCALSDAQDKAVEEVLALNEAGDAQVAQFLVDQCLTLRRVLTLSASATLTTNSGKSYEIEGNVTPMQDQDGNLLGAIMVLRDVTELREMQKLCKYQATHDPLTGLFNRREFESQLFETLKQQKVSSTLSTLLYLDLDQFKLVNDTCGHLAGDELLRRLATQLEEVVPAQGVFARLGGDEFALLLKNTDLEGACRVAERIRGEIEAFRFHWADKTFDLGVSIGVVDITDAFRDIVEVLTAADKACYAAKDSGRNRVHIYSLDDEFITRRNGELQWIQEIKRALEEDRFCLEAQSISNLTEAAGNVSRCEVLIRMLDRDGKLVLPVMFIPAAERFNYMPLIDRWVTETTVRMLSEHGIDDANRVRCFINLSGQTLSDAGFLQFVVELMDQYGVEPGCICFEITETAAISNFQRAQRLIHVLRGVGCEFALDDFGTGLSSFGYLKQLPVDYIKIDGSFVRNLAVDHVAKSVVEAIGQIVHTMGIRAIAEFVESDEVLRHVQNLRVDYAQGFGISRARPLQETLHGISSSVIH